MAVHPGTIVLVLPPTPTCRVSTIFDSTRGERDVTTGRGVSSGCFPPLPPVRMLVNVTACSSGSLIVLLAQQQDLRRGFHHYSLPALWLTGSCILGALSATCLLGLGPTC
ncbi:uncharacterized protein PHACADRAFT_263800 [Phanerochaete carnosa HHB-10118-sp]|uniref:Uncharacterized protein n=1 Tax=Phanerochaete carnosa (strain HHB-10118-sp) TaxID=650164 RepID=K5VV82_PHACS|nr:uncharacterized protein PHACADRAFT_263800 [Phanerochaete carnosa HHB-10118-sp]EKM50479.1 hypothetical protein PHACADRAFT_263800 [Phanerochaete carnosa HHB-10118-sp]